MDVSVIIINYNTKDLTMNCLRSVYASKTGYAYEVILVDNASSDGSVEEISQIFPNVRIIANKENVGFGRANNQAAEVSTGRYLYILNSDTEIEKDVIQNVVSYGDANPEAGIIGNRSHFPDGRPQESVYKFPSLLSELIFFAIGIIKMGDIFLFKLNKYNDLQPDAPLEVDVVAGFSMFIKRELYEQIGLFNERIFMFYEDNELCYRAKKTGYKNIYFPGAAIMHVNGGSVRKYRQNHAMLIKCYEGACVYFNETKGASYLWLFKTLCVLSWYAELLLFSLLNMAVRSKKVEKKLNMLKALIYR